MDGGNDLFKIEWTFGALQKLTQQVLVQRGHLLHLAALRTLVQQWAHAPEVLVQVARIARVRTIAERTLTARPSCCTGSCRLRPAAGRR